MGASPTRALYSATLSLSYRLISLNLITALYPYCDSYSQRYNWNDRTRTCLRFRPFIAISLHQLSYVPTARRLQPCVLIRNQFSDLFFVVINGDVRNRTEDWKKRRRETTYLSPPKRGRSLGNKMKNIKETSMNEIEGGTRTLNAFTTP